MVSSHQQFDDLCASPDIDWRDSSVPFYADAGKAAKTVLIIGTTGRNSIGAEIASACMTAGVPTIVTSRRTKFIEKLKQDGYDARYLNYPDDRDSLSALPMLKGVVFCLAKTDVQELKDGILATSEANFQKTLGISCFALIDLLRQVRPKLAPGSSVVALTFFGSSAVVPGYGLIGVAKAALEQTLRTLAWELGSEGIRVNAVSAGAVPTTSSRVIPGFSQASKAQADGSCLRRGVTQKEIAAAALWLLSSESGGMTGEILNVNGGMHCRKWY